MLLFLETWRRLRPLLLTTINLWSLHHLLLVVSFRILFLVVVPSCPIRYSVLLVLIPQWLLQATLNRHLLVVLINIIYHGLLHLVRSCLILKSMTTSYSLLLSALAIELLSLLLLLMLLLSVASPVLLVVTIVVIIIIIIVGCSIIVLMLRHRRWRQASVWVTLLLELHSLLLLLHASVFLMDSTTSIATVHWRRHHSLDTIVILLIAIWSVHRRSSLLLESLLRRVDRLATILIIVHRPIVVV